LDGFRMVQVALIKGLFLDILGVYIHFPVLKENSGLKRDSSFEKDELSVARIR